MGALLRRDAVEWAMSESVPVRCPACRREHVYAVPAYPCACGAPVTPVLDQGAPPTEVLHRVWDEEWVGVRCASCGRLDEWPRPELGCSCGTVLRVPVRGGLPVTGRPGSSPGPPRSVPPLPEADPPEGRPAFHPVTIRTARDAVTAAALYLHWLGYGDIRRADDLSRSGIRLAACGLLAQVDPAIRPASVRDVECLWLTAMAEPADCVYISLAGYAEDARTRADALGVPLFALDLTGTPQPVNDPAATLHATGA